MTQPVVVGLDGSPASQQALRYGAEQARRRGTTLRIVHALAFLQTDLPMETSPTGVYADLTQDAGEMLSQAQSVVEEQTPEVRVDTVLVPDAVESVLENESQQATLLVLGTRGHGGFVGLLSGSVSQHVADHARCPVIVVPYLEDPAEPDGPPRREVVIGIDEPSDETLGFAFEEATLCGARLHAIHAWRPPLGSEALGSDAPYREQFHTTLSVWQEKHPGVDVVADILPGKTSEVLSRASATADLVVIGSRRSHHLGSRMGALAHSLLRHSRCPVAVVPAG